MTTKHAFNIHDLSIGVVVASAALVLAPSFARADALSYQTGFEQPTFEIGPLPNYPPSDYQDGWFSWVGYGVEISAENPESGDQSVRVPGEGLELLPEFEVLWTFSGHYFEYDTIANGTPVIEVIVDTQLKGPSTDTGQGADDDLVSANLSVRADPWVYLGGIIVSSSGEVWIFGSRDEDNYLAGVPIDLEEYHRLGMRIDFSARTHQFFVDGDLAATLPIDPEITTNVFAFVSIPMGLVPDGIDPAEYTAYYDNFSVKAYMPLPFDVRPSGCPNPLNVKAKGVLPVAILGTETFDVSEIDPASIRLVTAQGGEGISPLRWSMETEDVATPYEPYIGKESAYDCNETGPDGYMDLTLKFDNEEVAAELGIVNDQQIKLFTISGKLKEKFGNTPIIGEDIALVR